MAQFVSNRCHTPIAAQIATSYGYRTPVTLRTAEQLVDVVAHHPCRAAGAAEETLHVLFLADLPDPGRVDTLDPGRSPPDTFIVRGREIFLQCPRGLARTRLSNDYFDSKLGTISTGRNWRTVTRLLALMEAQPDAISRGIEG